MFDAPPGYVHPPGPTKLFWPGLKSYNRVGPKLPQKTYPPVWFRTGRTNFPHTLPPKQEVENITQTVFVPSYRHVDSFELDTDPAPTVRIRTGRTRFPHTVHPFVKEALWGKVEPEDRESFTYPQKWMFDDMDDDFLIRSVEVTEPYTPIEAKAAKAWMDSSLFSETTLERPDMDEDSGGNLERKRPTYPPAWIRTGRTVMPRNVTTFIKKAQWGKVKPEDRESFTTNPIWMMDYEDFLLAEMPTESETLQPVTPTRVHEPSTLHTASWWTYPAYWVKLHPHLNVTERITTPEPLLEEGPAEWTRPPGVPELCPPGEIATSTTLRSFVFDILAKRKKSGTSKNGIQNAAPTLSLYEANRKFLNEPPRYPNNPRYDNPPPYANEYPRADNRDYRRRDPGPNYNEEPPRQFRDRPRYDRPRNPSFNNFHSRHGRGSSRFARQNTRFGRRLNFNQNFVRGDNNEEQTVTYRSRFRHRPKRSTLTLDDPIYQSLLDKLKSPLNIGLHAEFKNNTGKSQGVKFRPETLWDLLVKDDSNISNNIKNDYLNINNVRDSINNTIHLELNYKKSFEKYNQDLSTKMIAKRFADDDKEFNNNRFPKFDKYKKQTKRGGADEYLQKVQAEGSSSGSGSQSLSSRSFEREEDLSAESRDRGAYNGESDLSQLEEPTTYYPKAKPIHKQQLRRERATRAPKVIRVPFKRTVLRRTAPTDNPIRNKRDTYDDIDTTEPDPFFEAWLKSKREEEERERLLFGMEYGLTTPEPGKVVRKRPGRTKVVWVAKTKKPKVYVVPFTFPVRFNKNMITLKGGLKPRGRRKRGEASGVKLPFLTTLKPIIIEVTEHPGYFKFGKRIYWLTPRTTMKPTWLRPRRLKLLTTATTTELPSPKFATLMNIHRRTETPTAAIKKRRYRSRTFRTMRKLVLSKKSSSGSDIESDDMEEVDGTVEDSSDVDDDEPRKRTFPTLKLPQRKKQEVISFREYLQRRENKIREKEENMWNAQFNPESEEVPEEITTTVPILSTAAPISSTTAPIITTTAPIITTTAPIITTTIPSVATSPRVVPPSQTFYYTLPSRTPIVKPVKIYHSFSYSTQSATEETTLSLSTSSVKTRRPYRSRKPRATRTSRGTRSKRGRARRLSDFENVFPTITSSFADVGRTKRELLTPENERFEITTDGSAKSTDSVFEILNKQKIALQEAFFQKYEIPATETTTFEYNIDNLCQVYNVDYGKTSRTLYLKNICRDRNITMSTHNPLSFNSYYQSVEVNDSTYSEPTKSPLLNSYYQSVEVNDSTYSEPTKSLLLNSYYLGVEVNDSTSSDNRMPTKSPLLNNYYQGVEVNDSTFNDNKTPTKNPLLNSYYQSVEVNDSTSSDIIVKRSVGSNGRIVLDQRMRSVSKDTRRIPVDLDFNFTQNLHPSFDLYSARRKSWFNTSLKTRPVDNVTNEYAFNKQLYNNWNFRQSILNTSTYTPNFRQYFKHRNLWFNRTNDLHYEKKVEKPTPYREKKRWAMRKNMKKLQSGKKKPSINFEKPNAKSKEAHSIPNFSERDLINQRHRWGDKDYIPKFDKYSVNKLLYQPENPDQSIIDRENALARHLQLDKVIPVHMSLLEEVSDPDLMDRGDDWEVERYKPPDGFVEDHFGVNRTYKSYWDLTKKRLPHYKDFENRRLKKEKYKTELDKANGDYRKYPNLDALKQRRVVRLLETPMVVDDSEVMIDFVVPPASPTPTKTVDIGFESFVKAQFNLTTEATKLEMIDQYNRTYIHDTKLNKTYYPQHNRNMLIFSENETDTATFDKYIKERQDYYNLTIDIIFTHYIFSKMKLENISCTYGRMSNVINRWYNKTFFPDYRPNVYSKSYNIAMDRNYVQLLKNLELINEIYQNKIKMMTTEVENVTSKITKDSVTVRVEDEGTTRVEGTIPYTEEVVSERQSVTDVKSDELLSAEAMKKLIIDQQEMRRIEYEKELKRMTTIVTTKQPLDVFTHKMYDKPSSTVEIETISEETTLSMEIKTTTSGIPDYKLTLPPTKPSKKPKSFFKDILSKPFKAFRFADKPSTQSVVEIVTEMETTTEERKTSTSTKPTQSTKRKERTTIGIPDYKLTLPPTKPTKKPKSFFKTLLSKIKPMKLIKSWFSWGKTKNEPEE